MENSHFDDNSSPYTNGRQDEALSEQIDALNGVLGSDDKPIETKTGDDETKSKAIDEIKTQIKLCIQMSTTEANRAATVVAPTPALSQLVSIPDPCFFTDSKPQTEEEKEKILKQVRKHRNLNENRSKSKRKKVQSN
jgi:hypothetical protein